MDGNVDGREYLSYFISNARNYQAHVIIYI
jgi:hypothetical protein